jgi:hypothetical protein
MSYYEETGISTIDISLNNKQVVNYGLPPINLVGIVKSFAVVFGLNLNLPSTGIFDLKISGLYGAAGYDLILESTCLDSDPIGLR